MLWRHLLQLSIQSSDLTSVLRQFNTRAMNYVTHDISRLKFSAYMSQFIKSIYFLLPYNYVPMVKHELRPKVNDSMFAHLLEIRVIKIYRRSAK